MLNKDVYGVRDEDHLLQRYNRVVMDYAEGQGID